MVKIPCTGSHWYGTAFTPAGSSTYTTAEGMMKYARAVVERKAAGLAALDPAGPHLRNGSRLEGDEPLRAGLGGCRP